MRRIVFFIITMFQITSGIVMTQDFSKQVFNSHESYREPAITKRNFTHSDILPLLDRLKKHKKFSVSKAGESVEKRGIYLVTIGTGKIRVLLWSQMHGDESTATMALFDIFNFFSSHDEYDSIREKILNKLTLSFLPMLNPDGAERFQRRNAFDIDINRDAARLECPESRVLKSVRDSIDPEFGFNLHDQSPRYSAGNCFRSASISFLAPPINYQKDVNVVRERAMKLIVELNKVLSGIIPGHIAKYSDDFEPRAFGDNIQKWGTSTILVESGSWANDYQKQFLRKINFTLLLSAFLSIAEDSYVKNNIKSYYSIPDNKENIFDLLLRNVRVKYQEKWHKTDIGINRYEVPYGNKSMGYSGIIDDMGDLSTFYGYEEYWGDSLEAVPGETYPEVLASYQEVPKLNFEELLRMGITTVLVKEGLPREGICAYPILIQSAGSRVKMDNISMKAPANFILKKNGIVKLAIINGFVYNLRTSTNRVYNSLIVQ